MKSETNGISQEEEEEEQKLDDTDKWKEYRESSSGKCYYYNVQTKQTQWEKPNGPNSSIVNKTEEHVYDKMSQFLSRRRSVTLDPQKAKHTPEISQTINRLNAILDTAPEADTAAAAAPQALDDPNNDQASEACQDQDQALPSGWQKQWDETSKSFYYYHLLSQQTQWEIPSSASATAVAAASVHILPVSSSAHSSYQSNGSFNPLTGQFQAQGGDLYWSNKGIAADKAGRQMSNFFDLNQLSDNRARAKKRKEQAQAGQVGQRKDWKKIKAEKKKQKEQKRNQWLLED